MKRTTIKIPDDIDARLRDEAARRGMTVSELTREIFEVHFGVGRRRRLAAAGAGASGQSDVSQRIEELLAREWGGVAANAHGAEGRDAEQPR